MTLTFYGTKYYNDLLMEAGLFRNIQSEVLLQPYRRRSISVVMDLLSVSMFISALLFLSFTGWWSSLGVDMEKNSCRSFEAKEIVFTASTFFIGYLYQNYFLLFFFPSK
ncbi:hypothetical protein CFOL_v3_30828 [Cephalotus follicularis]|uniref:Uncharacterized protein n=1 Tax=Cephalotus follicularis TaxID=3775 RepID=A0A1Q3D4M0_CEPFO|nr:hypothetical protein CFOL_v3_30828 [Cephalotus follicularis]